MVEHVYKFDTIHKQPDEYVLYSVGRLMTANNQVIRIFFDKDGIKLYIPEICKSNGDVTFLKTLPQLVGIGKSEE